MWIKSLLGVLKAQVGVPKLPRHAQGDQTARAGPTTDTTAPQASAPTTIFIPRGWASAHEVLRGALRHALAFSTWRSLSTNGIGRSDAAKLITALIEAADGDR